MLQPVSTVPLYHAEAIGDPKESGSSLPLTMVCFHRTEEEDLQRDTFVVKFFGDLPLKTKGLARELTASLLGQVLGLNIPRVASVYISEALCEAAQPTPWHDKICKSVGVNFGSLLVQNPIEATEIPKSHLDAAMEVFSFDMLIQNLDRNLRKPNLFRTKEGFILIDHEKSFLCADPTQLLGIIPTPWEFDTLNPKTHLCYPALKSQGISCDGFVDRVSSLSDSVLDEIIDRVPTEWASPELENIRGFLIQARDDADKFKRSLQEVLA